MDTPVISSLPSTQDPKLPMEEDAWVLASKIKQQLFLAEDTKQQVGEDRRPETDQIPTEMTQRSYTAQPPSRRPEDKHVQKRHEDEVYSGGQQWKSTDADDSKQEDPKIQRLREDYKKYMEGQASSSDERQPRLGITMEGESGVSIAQSIKEMKRQ